MVLGGDGSWPGAVSGNLREIEMFKLFLVVVTINGVSGGINSSFAPSAPDEYPTRKECSDSLGGRFLSRLGSPNIPPNANQFIEIFPVCVQMPEKAKSP